MSENVVELTVENFNDVIVDGSQSALVAVYFYAPWDEPSMEMLPNVQALAQGNTEHLTLALVNCEEQQQITAQFGVRGLPTIMLVKEGQPIDGAAGPQDSEQLKALFDKHLPKPEEGMLLQAAQLIEAHDYQQAYTYAKQAFDLNTDWIDARFALADCTIELGQVDAAKELLAPVTMVDQDARYQVILGKIELAEKAAESPELIELQTKLDADPENDEIKLQLAIQLQQAHKVEQALDLLLSILRKDMGFGDAKKITLDTINALPDGEPLKSVYRRKIYSLLY